MAPHFRTVWQVGLCFLSLGVAGCAPLQIEGDDTWHFVVIGAGIVSIPKQDAPVAVDATKIEAIGLTIADRPGSRVSLGYMSNTSVRVPDNAEDVLLEVSDETGGPMTLRVGSARLAEN